MFFAVLQGIMALLVSSQANMMPTDAYSCLPRDQLASGLPWSALPPTHCALALQDHKAQVDASLRRSRSGLLFFLHVHKAGGTTLCNLARLGGFVTETTQLRPDWDTNCVPIDTFRGSRPLARRLPVNDSAIAWRGGACWIQETGLWHQQVLADLLTSGHLQPAPQPHPGPGPTAEPRSSPSSLSPAIFVASEGALPDRLYLPANYSRITMLREPLDRTLSSYHWWREMKGRWPSPDPTFASLCQSYAAPDNATFEDWLDAYPDNWMTRAFLGRSFLYSRTALRSDDFRDAVQRLHYFSAVLILEDFNSSMQLLGQKFGWRLEAEWELGRKGSSRGSDVERELKASPEILAKLRWKNFWDLQLYEEGKRIFMAALYAAGIIQK